MRRFREWGLSRAGLNGRASEGGGLATFGRAAAFSVVALLSLAAAGPAHAQERSVVIEDMRVIYDVQRTGDVEVEERYRVRFNGSWNGLERIVKLGLPAAYGYDQPAGFHLETTTNLDGERRRNEVSRRGPETVAIRVYVPDANNRTAGVVIRYTLQDALAFFAADPERGLPAMDELYWQVTGTEWEAPIREASAEVHLPDFITPAQAAAYQGGDFSQDSAAVVIQGSTVRVGPAGPFDPGEGLTLGVGWPAGTVARDPDRVIPYPQESLAERAAPPRPGPLTFLPLLLPIAVFWLAYRAWDARGRDPKKRAIVVQWEPPEDLSPAEVGTLVDHSPQMHDIISTLVELAVMGYVIIEEREKKGFLQFGEEYVFHLVRPRSEWDGLLPHQRRFLDGLFKHRGDGVGGLLRAALGFEVDASVGAPTEAVASVGLADLKNEFYKEIPEIKDAIFDGLVRKGHYLRRPDKVRGVWVGGGAVVGGLGAFGAVMLTSSGTVSPWFGIALGAGAVVSAVVLMVFGFIMPARTEKGARAREAALGFKDFLKKVESPRYRRMIKSPDQFEEFLPYAMAFQCQEEWAKAFDDLLTEPPQWYYGHHGHFHATSFASDMGKMATTAGSTMASSPGGSGSGGGGSVGGGGGGGGGGGF